MILFLTSSPTGTYRSEEAPDFSGLDPANGMVDRLRQYWVDNARCLMISAFPDEYSVNDTMRRDFEGILKDTGLSVSCLDLCDSRNGKEIADRLHDYDFVLLGGGHVPTEMAFFSEIGLPERFTGFDGIVMGISAGSMNCARIVYAQPEMPGEALDPSYRRFIPGLSLTEFNILPHYNAVKNDYVDGLRLMEDITCADSMGRTFYAIVDGSYLFQTTADDGTGLRAEICGEAYRIQDGRIEQICGDGETIRCSSICRR